MEEIWKDIKKYEGKYQVSNFGRIKSLEKDKILKQNNNKSGYLYIGLCKNGKRKNYRVHRIVAQAFIPNPENKKTINHIDGNKYNNNVENLEWSTYEENNRHAVESRIK